MFASGKKVLSGAGGKYVDRGDPAAVDFAQGDLTTDGTWNDLDLSAIVPSGAVAVCINVYVQDNVVGSALQFRTNGTTNAIINAVLSTQVANIFNYGDFIVALDSGRVIEYKGANLAFTAIGIAVKGWWI